MKSPFRQQATEYDCVPTTFVNALSYLFEREEIPPLVIQRIYLYCLDSLASHKKIAHGTSGSAIQLLGSWLNDYKHKKFKLHAEFCVGKSVHFGQGNKISNCLNNGGTALFRVTHQGNYWHYILGLSVNKEWVNCFDPYPKSRKANKVGFYEFLREGGLHQPNLKISRTWLNTMSNNNQFQLGTKSERECLLLQR
ncbi:MAG: hypothetical protein JSR26_13150 [Proteobacteria bacterium]|nr:hypothetical protein [Pseudomonadota bacterium]